MRTEGFQELSDELLQEFKSNGASSLFLFLIELNKRRENTC